MTLAQRLFLRILPTIIITIALIGFLAYRSATREINNIYDAQLINDANVLWSLLRKPLSSSKPRAEIHVPDLDFNMNNQLAINDEADDYADAHAYRAWRNNVLALESSNPFPSSDRPFKSGFTDISFQNAQWRIYSLPIADSDVVVEVAENIELRQTLVGNILTDLALPLLILIPIIACITWLAIDNGLRTIRDLVRQIRSRNSDDLSKISVMGQPRDLAPLIQSLNALLQKLERSIILERQFSDLAAHQLRTPQAGIKLLLQLLERSDTDEERKVLVADLISSNERAMHLIEQLLRLARVSHQTVVPEIADLNDLTASCLADFGPIFASRDFEVQLQRHENAFVSIDRALFRVMLDNVVDNAIKYSPDGGRIVVAIDEKEGGWTLSISDTGPGIPVDQRSNVFQRFNRLMAADDGGAGLGLTIVADIASRLGIQTRLDTPEWGYGLRLNFDIPAS